MKYKLVAPCGFGIESVLSYEAKKTGAENVTASDGRVSFEGSAEIIARANLCLRSAERVMLVLGSFKAASFTELFDNVTGLEFERFLSRDSAFPVAGWSLKSTLYSIPDCQSIIKKAIVNRLGRIYGADWLPETGPVYQVRFSILKDEVTIMLDTSGVGLHKRGYRKTANLAPIKETLAAAICDLARTRQDSFVYDPMCGSGTLLIEAGLRAFNIAPGLRREFACEKWEMFQNGIFKLEREKAMSEINRTAGFKAFGSDIDTESITICTENAKKAGVSKKIEVKQADILDFNPQTETGIVICNPPYGERLLEIKEAEQLYKKMGRVFIKKPGFSYCIISPHEEFEAFFGRKADKKRKLYNGMIKCNLFMYSAGN